MNFLILFFLCLGSGIAQTINYIQPRSSSDVFDYDGNDDVDSGPFVSGFVTFW